MKLIKTKTTSMFTITLAALLVAGCNVENPEPDPDPTPDPDPVDFYEEKGWELVWSDEFDGTAIDSSKWAHEVNCWGGGNDEHQCYVDSDDNAFVQDGKLHIKAIRGEHTGATYNPDSPDYDPADETTQSFTSARLRSISPMPYQEGVDASFNFRNDWKFGRFEIRAKLPEGQGTWPAIWMLPTDWEFGGWASSGEIDIMEAVNLKADREVDGEIVPENRVHGTLHYGREWPANIYSGVEFEFGDHNISPADDFHTYAIEWEEGAIRWFVDGEHYATQTKEGWYTHFQDEEGNWQSSGDTSAPFDKKFHMILNLAIGGNWAANVNEGGVDENLNEAEMVVDFVRVYQCTDDATGVACGSKGEEGTYTLQSGSVEPNLPDVPANPTTGPLTIYSELNNPVWSAWDCCGGTLPSIVVDADAAYGNTMKFDIVGETVVGFTSRSDHGVVDGEPHDASRNTTLEFDLKMTAEPTAGSATWMIKMESLVDGNLSVYEKPLTDSVEGVAPTLNTWQHYTFNIADLQTAGLNPAGINIIMVFPAWGTGDGASFQMDNVEFVGDEDPVIVVTPPTTGELTIFEEAELDSWKLWGEKGSATVVAEGGDYGNVAEFSTVGQDVAGFTTRTATGVKHDMTGNKTLSFDFKLVTAPTSGTDVWKMKLESGSSQATEVDLTLGGDTPVVGEWKSYTFDLTTMPMGTLDTTALDLIMIFANWADNAGAVYRIDNLKLTNEDAGVPPTPTPTTDLVVLDTALASGFTVENFWQGDPAAAETIVETNGVYTVTFAGNGNVGIGSASALNLTDYAALEFDLKLTDLGTATDLAVKLDSGWPNIAPVNISTYRTGGFGVDADFVSYSIPISDFVSAGQNAFNIASVVNPLVFEPIGGGDIQFEFANVHFAAPAAP